MVDSTAFVGELCSSGAALGIDKTPIHHRPNAHRHPYTAVYTMLFSPLMHRSVLFAEIGIAGGGSALLWESYFKHPDAKICMFDCDAKSLNNGRRMLGNRGRVGYMDVRVDGDVARALRELSGGELYDVILDDSSHNFEDQVRIVREALPLLKTGGMLVIEDVFRATPENEYLRALKDVFSDCAAAYFVDCEHVRRWSPGWDNDKLLILVNG
ncbi:MAG: class I SAM-dependent methyltransferase [Planctomycetota bacterium]|nr:class I SAM-dependent methyltransferase [Planctomycetota bacterium]